MVKFREASPGAAYEIAVGVTDAEEASKLGLAVVEHDPSSGAPTAYGRYKGAPDGGPLGITTAVPADTEVIGGGTVGPNTDATTAGGQKGDVLPPNDPFVHGGTGDETIHADGSAPGTVGYTDADHDEARQVAEQSIEDASKPTRRKK